MRLALIALSLAACTSATAEAPSTQPAMVTPAGSPAPARAAAPDLAARVPPGPLKAPVFPGRRFWLMAVPFQRPPRFFPLLSGLAAGPRPTRTITPTNEQQKTGKRPV